MYTETRQYISDSGFRQGLNDMCAAAPEDRRRFFMHDPRLAQAYGVLLGQPAYVKVSEADVKYAESVGDIKKRDPIQMADIDEAMKHSTLSEAKQAGNEHFQAAECVPAWDHTVHAPPFATNCDMCKLV